MDIFIGMSDGSILKLSSFQNWKNPDVQSKFFVDLEEDTVGICNTARRRPANWPNTKNHSLYYNLKTKSLKKLESIPETCFF